MIFDVIFLSQYGRLSFLIFSLQRYHYLYDKVPRNFWAYFFEKITKRIKTTSQDWGSYLWFPNLIHGHGCHRYDRGRSSQCLGFIGSCHWKCLNNANLLSLWWMPVCCNSYSCSALWSKAI